MCAFNSAAIFENFPGFFWFDAIALGKHLSLYRDKFDPDTQYSKLKTADDMQ